MGDMPKAAWNVVSQTRKRYAFPFALAICFSNNDLFGPKKRDIGSFKGAEVTSFHVRSTTSRGPTPFSSVFDALLSLLGRSNGTIIRL